MPEAVIAYVTIGVVVFAVTRNKKAGITWPVIVGKFIGKKLFEIGGRTLVVIVISALISIVIFL